MAQLNIHMTPEFEKRLAELMSFRGIRTKSEAIRVAVHEAVQRCLDGAETSDFRSWVGAGLKAPLNPNPRFRSHDDLWE